ncbi:flagellar transcriptional regulator FlhC [Achromobacter sp. F4_2707]|uniref:flagellar transcriptional regulator FlhC n=1 Tax=Achromobacter sp. F4_2707 TaxID=3114286 RepID=UPI0039C66E2E
MTKKSVAKEAEEILLATDMIQLGARLQVLQAETSLSYDRLARLYREVRGCSPPKGMLPFSVDWFMTWLPNIHSSVFYSVYRYLDTHTPAKKSRALVEAYRLYIEQAATGLGAPPGEEPVLSFTRAWMLIRFFDSNLLQLSYCERCNGGFIAHAHDPQGGFVCAICRPPPRAGKTRKRRAVAAPKSVDTGASAGKNTGEPAAAVAAAKPARQATKKKRTTASDEEGKSLASSGA